MVVLYFADIFGRPGRQAIRQVLPDLKAQYSPDFIVGNAENLAGGRGVNRKTLEEMFLMGFSGFTSGNHIWDNKEVYSILEKETRLIRPANWFDLPSDPCPGKGWTILRCLNRELALVNLMGRVFMEPLNCPFLTIDKVLKEIPAGIPILVDMHADATSEKYAMAWHLDGKVAAVMGSHSHVQTADERILPKGTAYITDVGMTGSFDSVIGLRPPEVIRKFMIKRPVPTMTAKENPGICAVVLHLERNGRATKIERLRMSVESPKGWENEKDME